MVVAMRAIAVILVLAAITSAGCINPRYPPGVAADPGTTLPLGTGGDAWAVQREIMNAASTPK